MVHTIYTIEYYSAMKKNEIKPSAATWMQLQIFTVSEVNQETNQETRTISPHICRM